MVDVNGSSVRVRTFAKTAYPWRGTQNYLNVRIFNRQPALDLIRLPEAIELRKPSQDCPVRACGGDSWTRTNDPIDVNDVLWLCGRVCNKIMKLCSNRWSLWFQRNWRFSCFTGGCSAKGCSGGVHGFMNTGCSGCSGGCSRSGVFILFVALSSGFSNHLNYEKRKCSSAFCLAINSNRCISSP